LVQSAGPVCAGSRRCSAGARGRCVPGALPALGRL